MPLIPLRFRTAAFIAAVVTTTTTCQFADVLRPAGLEDLTLVFASDSVLVVAAPVRPLVSVTVNGAPFEGARLALASSDTDVVAVHGDTLVPKRRGTVTLEITLQSSAMPRTPPRLERVLRVVADTVTLDSTSVHLASLSDTVTLVATARDALAAAIAGTAATWSSSDTGVVTVRAAGRLTAKGIGTATVRAMVDLDTAAVTVRVSQVLVRWTFAPSSRRLESLSETTTVFASGLDARGNPIPFLAPASWSVWDATIVTVSAGGVVTSRRNGSTFVYAALGNVRDSLLVTVAQRGVQIAVAPDPVPTLTSVGAQVQLIARVFDRQGVEIQAAVPLWFTLDPGSARVNADGLVTALATGTARVVASLDAGADTAAVSISNNAAAVLVAPDSALATSVGDTLVFRAVARNGRGDSVAAAIDWRTPDAAIVDLRSDGRAIALAVGTARVIATVGGLADTGLAKVTNVPTAIDITPTNRAYPSLGEVDTLAVTITNARGAALPRGAVTWTSDDATIARVGPSGIVTARDTGQTVIRATSGAVTDSVVVTVQNLPASIVINSLPVDTLTAVGQSLTLPTDVRNARGAPITNFAVAWRSTNRTVVDTVMPTGVAVAVGYGNTILVAQAGAAADTVALTVRNPTRIYVNNVAISGSRYGTSTRPYARIQDGVNAADALDTVIVMRGIGPYSESVALSRRVTLLGDSTAWLAGGRNPALLPLLAHDTGAAAILATTTAPTAVKYLSVRHTLDGPAFASDGSDAQLEWLYVNPPGTVTTRIGRGIVVRNSSSGTNLRNLRVRSVRGYGISLVNSSSALISDDSIVGVDSIGVPERGAGISLEGGSTNVVQANVIRSTRGPRVLVRGAATAAIQNQIFSGRHPLIHLDSVTGLVQIRYNTFQIGFDLSDAGDSPDCSVDTRCAGVLITDSRQGALAGGYGYLSFTSPVDLLLNTFYESQGTANPVPGSTIGIRVRRSTAYGQANTFRYLSTAHLLEGNSKGYFINATADTSQWLATLTDEDSVYFGGAATHEAGVVNHFNETSGLHPFVQVSYGRFSRATGNLVNIWDLGTNALFEDAVFKSAPNNDAITFHGNSLTLYRDSVLGVGDTVSGYQGGYDGGVSIVTAATNVYFYQTRIQGFTKYPGLSLFFNVGAFSAQENVITGNRVGVRVAPYFPGSIGLQGSGNNSVFDNVEGGLQDERTSGTGLPQWWWGDNRGPRGNANPAATGDSVIDAPVAQTLFLTAPPMTGTAAAELRHVRGTGQTAPRNTTLPRALTVRVVDANGLPVGGVVVTFNVTGGGGNLAGLTSRTVTTGSDGLAEVTLTLGAAPGVNAVTATVPGIGTVTFAATGT